MEEQPTQLATPGIDMLGLLQQQAREHLHAKHWSQAEEAFKLLHAHGQQNEETLLGTAAALDGMEHYESLYNIAQEVLETVPNSAQGLAYKARALQKLERLSEATIANDQALLLDTSLGLAWINRSGLHLLQQKLPEALRSSSRAVKLAPSDARAWINKSIALLNFNRLAEALEAIDTSISLDAGSLFSLQIKGEILCKLGRMREVMAVAHHALTMNPAHIPSLTQTIQALRALEMYDALKDAANALIQLTPESLFARENYMRGLRGAGHFAQANEALDDLLGLDASNVRFWTLKADTLYRLERYREAASVAEQALQLADDYWPAHRIHEKALRLMYQKKGKKEKLI